LDVEAIQVAGHIDRFIPLFLLYSLGPKHISTQHYLKTVT